MKTCEKCGNTMNIRVIGHLVRYNDTYPLTKEEWQNYINASHYLKARNSAEYHYCCEQCTYCTRMEGKP